VSTTRADWRMAQAERRARKQADGFAGMAHGTAPTYTVGCRCDACREAWRVYYAGYQARRRANGFAGMEHGRAVTYRMGCRCGACVLGRALWRNDRPVEGGAA